MSVRRPKMQIKPKVSTRAMTAKAAGDATTKRGETVVKTIEMSPPVKETSEEVNKGCDDVDRPMQTPLTTSIVAISDSEDNSQTDECDKSATEDRVETETEVTLLVEASNKTSQPKEPITPDMDSKHEKSKPKTKSRKRKIARNGQNSDKSVMRMKDLLLYNPPMTDEQKEMKEKDSELSDKPVESVEPPEEHLPTPDNEDLRPNVGPRVKVGADGQLILDEESVIVKRKRSDALSGPALLECASTTSACTNYSSFRSKNRCSSKPRWTEHETIRFYSALNTIGTDFTLMADLFFRGKRSRLDLRNKFKKEEKVNKLMIDEALFSPNTFINQCPELDDLLADSSDSDDDSGSKSGAQKASLNN